jgi:sterol desaturase/sphingolipid hydroxylase (fatty acid hydroxylase superfamily)
MPQLDALNLIFIGLFVGLCILDTFYHPRPFPQVRYWRVKGVVFFVIGFLLNFYSPYVWDAYFGAHRLIDATRLPLPVAVIVGLFIYEFGVYVWHRAGHKFQWLWRWNHQIHHSAERIDIYGAYYFHPLDILAFAFLGSFFLVLVFGVSPDAAAIIGFITNLLAVLQHSNIKTPTWLGWFVMRPEAHNEHHQRGVHYRNFGDIPHWDMIFGTYHNPPQWQEEAGFYDGASARLADMFMGRDVSQSSGRK